MRIYTANANKISVLEISYIVLAPFFGSYTFYSSWLFLNGNFNKGDLAYQVSSGVGPFPAGGSFTTWATIIGADVDLNSNN